GIMLSLRIKSQNASLCGLPSARSKHAQRIFAIPAISRRVPQVGQLVPQPKRVKGQKELVEG
ncbi:hypothetical protein, partial [Rothia mucilaginosa]|uniref:hypothetical protein n=1 Tax=Rothia mucilaginosa TaxID=43675 RepID=UPI003C763229